MRPNVYDPSQKAGDKNYNTYHDGVAAGTADALGPAGKATNTEHNEKAILESGVFEAMSMEHASLLPAQHDGFRQGIYKTNSAGDND